MEEKVKYCVRCGAAIGPEDSFCGKCGARVGGQAAGPVAPVSADKPVKVLSPEEQRKVSKLVNAGLVLGIVSISVALLIVLFFIFSLRQFKVFYIYLVLLCLTIPLSVVSTAINGCAIGRKEDAKSITSLALSIAADVFLLLQLATVAILFLR